MTVTLTDRALLEAWAVNTGAAPAERADALLARSLPSSERERLCDWPLARRNAALAELRRSRWGPGLEAAVACPACGEQLELTFDLDAVRGAAATATPAPDAETVEVETDDGGWELRLPTAADVAAAAAAGDVEQGRRDLIARCLIRAPEPAAGLDSSRLEALAEALAEADPFGSSSLEIECLQCHYCWQEPLDVGDFLAREAALEAREIVAEVHLLASAYGWSEAEVLELPRERRRAYLELIG